MNTPTLAYAEALGAIMAGRCAARLGWRTVGLFAFMRPADVLPVSFIPKVKLLPESVKRYVTNQFKGETHYPTGEEITIPFREYLCLLATDLSIVNGWSPSPEDEAATDWVILD